MVHDVAVFHGGNRDSFGFVYGSSREARIRVRSVGFDEGALIDNANVKMSGEFTLPGKVYVSGGT